MQSEDITFFAGVPTMWWGLLGALTDDVDVDRIAANLRIGVSGGASLPVEIIKQVKERFHVQILEGYGLSETSPVATFSDPDRDPRPGSIGVPIWGVQCKLIDDDWNEITEAGEVGEIAIKGHNIMKGYYNRPEATAEVMKDGWFRSGDLGRRDEDGFYYIVDRSKDMIIRGGYNVYPREIEEVLMTHEAVSLAAVIGVPHESHGEEVKAVVIRAEGAEVTEDELVAWAKEQMAAYKYPRIVEFVDTLPMTATGKILKRELTDRCRWLRRLRSNRLETTRSSAGERVGQPARQLGEQLARLGGHLVLDQHLVPRRHHLRHRREVALAAGGGVPGDRPDQPEHRAEDDGRDDDGHHVGVGEQREDQPDEQAEPQARQRAAGGDPAVAEPAGDPLDPLQVGADDHALLDRELVVGEEVDGLLRRGVLVVHRQRLRELQLERRGRASGPTG